MSPTSLVLGFGELAVSVVRGNARISHIAIVVNQVTGENHTWFSPMAEEMAYKVGWGDEILSAITVRPCSTLEIKVYGNLPHDPNSRKVFEISNSTVAVLDLLIQCHRAGHSIVQVEGALPDNSPWKGTIKIQLRIVAAVFKTWEALEQEVDINGLPDATARVFLQLLRNFLVFMEVYRPGDSVHHMPILWIFTWAILSLLWVMHKEPPPGSSRQGLIMMARSNEANPIPPEKLFLTSNPAQDVLIQLKDLLFSIVHSTGNQALNQHGIVDEILVEVCKCAIVLERVELQYSEQSYTIANLRRETWLYEERQRALFALRFETALLMQGHSLEIDTKLCNRNHIVKKLASLSVCESAQHTSSDDGPLGAMEILARPFTSALASPRGIECEHVFACLLDLVTEEHDCHVRNKYRRILTRLVQTANKLPGALWVQTTTYGIEIRTGGFSRVYAGQSGGRDVAIKVPNSLANLPTDEKLRNGLYLEIISWRTVRHPFVLEFFGLTSLPNEGAICLVSPLMPKRTVQSACSSRKEHDTQRALILCQVAEGMSYLHDEGVIHGDLKAANIFVDSQGDIKIADFGLCVYSEGFSTNYCSMRAGNVRWIAPELIAPHKYGLLALPENPIDSSLLPEDGIIRTARPTKKSDVYSFACVCIEIFSGKIPFEGVGDAQVIDLVPRPVRRRPDVPLNLRGDADVCHLVQRCWHNEINKRPNFSEIHAITNRIYSDVITKEEERRVEMQL